MTPPSILRIVTGASVLMLLSALFMLYQNPLLEIYLANWGLC